MGEVSFGSELVWTDLNGVVNTWDVFMEDILSKENMPSSYRIWDDFFQEETQGGLVHGSYSTSREDEDNVPLTSKRKKKLKKGPKKGEDKQ